MIAPIRCCWFIALALALVGPASSGGDGQEKPGPLEQVTWPRNDPRWFTVLEQPLRTWTHGSGSADWSRDTYIQCFRLILERSGSDVCLKDPGFGTDIVVSADLKAITKVWLGDLRFDEALRSRSIVIEGPRKLVQALPGWLLLSGFAEVARPPRALAI